MQMHDGIERLIDSLTPGNVERIAKDAAVFDEVILVTAMAVSEAEQLLLDAVTSARSAGRTWTQIGNVLGISRQEAQARFTGVGKRNAGPNSPNETALTTTESAGADTDLQALGFPNRRAMRNLPFRDVDALNQAGKFGWHSVKVGMNVQRSAANHIIEQAEEQWEHAYTGPLKKMPASEGWRKIDSPRGWGIAYWARPSGTPVLPGNPDPERFVLM